MSGKKKKIPSPPTALMRRARPDLSDADLVALLNQHVHLFGRAKGRATFDPASEQSTMTVHNEKDIDPKGSCLIYNETAQGFVGILRRGFFLMKGPENGGRVRLVFFPAAQA